MKANVEVEFLKVVRKFGKTDPKLCKKVAKAVFRYATDNKKVPFVSEEALKTAKAMGISLSDKNWCNQPKFDKGRKIFHYEHCNPIKQLTIAVIDTKEAIESVLERNITCWIKKSEDKALNDNKFKDDRPGGYELCYKKSGIKIRKNK